MKLILSIIIILSCSVLLGKDSIEDSLREAIGQTSDESKLVDLYKALGDRYAALGKKEEAASAYKLMKNWELSITLAPRIEEIKKLAREDKLDQAIYELRALITQYPDLLQAHLLLALYLGWKKDFPEAIKELDRVLKVDSENREALLTKAHILRWQGNPGDAILLYKKLLEQKEDFFAHWGLVWAYMDINKISEANQLFQSLRPRDKSQQADYDELSSALAKKSEEAKGMFCSDIEKQIRENSDFSQFPFLYKALGDCLAKNGWVHDANQAYIKALAYSGLPLEDRLSIINYLGNTGSPEMATEILKQMLKKDPENVETTLLLAKFLGAEGKFAQSNRLINQVLKKSPDNVAALVIKANNLRLGGHYQEAISLYHSILDQGENFEARIGLVWAELKMLHFAEVSKNLGLLNPATPAQVKEKEELQSVIAEEKMAPDVLKNSEKTLAQAWELADEKKYDEALQAVDAVLAINPENTQAIFAKATILRRSQRVEESIPLYFSILKNQEDFDARLGLAWAYLDLGRRGEADLNFRLLSPTTEEQNKSKEELARASEQATPAEEINCNTIQQMLAEAKEPPQIGSLYKKLGDCLAKKGEEKKAIAAYEKALALPYDIFNESDRIDMIRYLGMHEARDSAIAALRQVLARSPKSVTARVLFARFLSWNGKYPEALAQSDVILGLDPENSEALLIKANTLRWSEKYQEALPIYLSLLSKKEDFDARLGLAWDYIYLEQFDKAEENLALLVPEYPEQIKEEKELREGLAKERIEAPKRRMEKCIAWAMEGADTKNWPCVFMRLNRLLWENPCNASVRVALSRVLSWTGRYRDALYYVRSVLVEDPRNVEALVIGGNVLRWRGSPDSFGMYQYALSIDPKHFYGQLGLAYAFNSRTLANSAVGVALGIEPEDWSQRNDLYDLQNLLHWAPEVSFRFFRYQDSDNIDTKKYTIVGTTWINDCQVDLFCRMTDNTQPSFIDTHPTLIESSTMAEVEVFRSINPYLDFGGGIGYANIRRDSEGDFLVGNLRANVFTNCGTFSLGSEYDVYMETAAALFFKIRTWSNYVTYVNYLSGSSTIGGSYFHVRYSDDNFSNRVGVWGKQKIFDCVFQIYAKYDMIYMDFANQPVTIFAVPSVFSGGHGYFDPKNYFSNQLMFLGVYECKNIYITGYPFVGYVTYHQTGLHYNGVYFGAGILWGLKFTRHFLMELTAEGARYPLTHLNYKYNALGAWLKLAF